MTAALTRKERKLMAKAGRDERLPDDPIGWRTRNHEMVGPNADVPGQPPQVADADGRIGSPLRTFDTVLRLYRESAITTAQYMAGVEFRDAYERAYQGSVRAVDWVGERRGSDGGLRFIGAIDAERKVQRDLLKVQGSAHPTTAGRALVEIVGKRRSIRAFAEATRYGPDGHMTERTARSILVGALQILGVEKRT